MKLHSKLREALTPSAVLLAVVSAALIIFPMLCSNLYVLGLAFSVLMGIATASAWNIVGGYAGQYSFGHAAYFGSGAYTTLVLVTKFDVNPVFGVIAGVAVALILAGLTGTIVFRLRGHYFGLASIAVAEIFRLCVLNVPSVTNGTEGVNAAEELARYELFSAGFESKIFFYYLALALVVAVISATYYIQRSKLGFGLQAIREDQDAACSLGINLLLYKNSALMISAAFTAVAGSIYALYIRYIDVASTLTLDMSIEMMLIAIIGGVGTVYGPAVGALVLLPLAEILRSNVLTQMLINGGFVDENGVVGVFLKNNLAHAHVLIYGIVTVIVIIGMPNGILGAAKMRFNAVIGGTKS